MEQVELFGTHGTCATVVGTIKGSGFKASQGRIGSGAYFWYDTDSFDGFGLELGKAWGRYKFPKSAKRSVIYVKISCSLNEYIDIEIPEVKIAIGQVAQKFGKAGSDYTKIHNLFITQYEKRKSLKIKVLQGRVAPPPPEHFTKGAAYDMRLLGAPVSICVIDPKSCVSIITEVEH